MSRADVLVVGAGLIGTSIGMALTASGRRVVLDDRDPAAVRTAAALGAGSPAGDGVAAEVAVVAVPPSAIAPSIIRLKRTDPHLSIIHVCSVQAQPLAEIEASGADLSNVLGTHPMAGRERGGPAAASAALFRDRPWVLCPYRTDWVTQARAEELIAACGAYPVVMTPQAHDTAVALVSHLPQLVSSAMAGVLRDAPGEAVAIAGTGLRDLTRLAGSDAGLWTEILTANAAAVSEQLARFSEVVSAVRQALAAGDADRIGQVLALGQQGRARLGGKHGGGPRPWASVQVVVPDRPGALVEVLLRCRDLAVNVEDLAVEHVPGQPLGRVELMVDPERASELADALREGWDVIGVVRPHGSV